MWVDCIYVYIENRFPVIYDRDPTVGTEKYFIYGYFFFFNKSENKISLY